VLTSIIGLLQAFLSICFVLGSIALVHEFGHYITAKLTGIWVIEFAIGFGNRLLKYKYGETIYSLRPFPLGGFVRLAGMDEPEEEEQPTEQAVAAAKPGETGATEPTPEEKTPAPPPEPIDPDDILPTLAPDDPRGFPSKSRLVKTLVLSAGSAMNLVWAVVLFIFIYAVFGGYLSNIAVLDVAKGKPAATAGIRAGDVIAAIDGISIQDWSDGVKMIQARGGKKMTLDVLRNHPEPQDGLAGGIIQEDSACNNGNFSISIQEKMKFDVVPEGDPGYGLIGISLAPNNFDFKELPMGKAVEKGFYSTLDIIMQTGIGFIRMFTGKTSADVAGPVKIMQMIKDQSRKGLSDLLYLTALLSVNIGLINMMPFPVLDGGRIVFILLEALFTLLNMVTGIKLQVTPQMEEKVHFAGLIFLLCVLVLVTYKDIRSFF
jgi:regulator of sigma E protease